MVCPYHAWSYDLAGSVLAAHGSRDATDFEPSEHGLVELGVRLWQGWVFCHAARPLGAERIGFEEHVGSLAEVVAPYAPEDLVLGDRHTYEVAANGKVVAETYHECYHCPLIHPELCQVSPPTSGDNYDLPGILDRWPDGPARGYLRAPGRRRTSGPVRWPLSVSRGCGRRGERTRSGRRRRC